MPTTNEEEIRNLILRVDALAVRSAQRRSTEDHTAERVDSLVRTAFVDLPLTADGYIDSVKWAALDPDDQENRLQTLVRLKDSLEVLLSVDGPSDPQSFMYREFVSNQGVIALSLFALIGTLAILTLIYFNWSKATRYVTANQQADISAPRSKAANPDPISYGPEEKDVLLMVMLMGSLGGFIHLTSSLTKYIGNRNLVRSWIVYYLLMPLEGSGLAITVYLMVRVGVLNPSATNADATKNLNWVGIYALSTLTGLFSKQALEMLGDVFSTIFRRVEAKDSGKTGRALDDPPGKFDETTRLR